MCLALRPQRRCCTLMIYDGVEGRLLFGIQLWNEGRRERMGVVSQGLGFRVWGVGLGLRVWVKLGFRCACRDQS
jgi:hypothetical protein